VQRLTVLYDGTCELCQRCRLWMQGQPAFLDVELIPADSPLARQRYGEVPWLGEELVVVSDEGDVWVGAAAFLVCLWALVEWREWSYRLSGPTLAPVAERFFHSISEGRRSLGALLAGLAGGAKPVRCNDGTCRVDGYRATR
jgi:predicted DCC family thiol-disulfide oxidoreductase YuxK